MGIEIWGNFITLAIILTYSSLIMMLLYKKKKIISTLISILVFLGIAVVTAAIGIPLGLF